MNIYFDTEFTGLHKNTTLISLGMVADNGKSFYAEFTDYDESQCDDWIKENVIANLKFKGGQFTRLLRHDDGRPNINAIEMRAPKEIVREQLRTWLKQFDSVQFVSDVCHYDFVLLIDLFGTAFDLPSNVNASCHDINQDIARHYGISEKEAFDLSREELLKNVGIFDGAKHNSLYDAFIIRTIYYSLPWMEGMIK